MGILGFDTSNYTTSVAYFDEKQALPLGQLLTVPKGALGLRQQEALFQHVKALPSLLAQLPSPFPPLSAVGVASRPRNVEGSYMPCFVAGEHFGKTLAQSHNIPCYEFSHQQGHLAAALFSLKREDLFHSSFLAWHLSGGTCELLKVSPAPTGDNVSQSGDLFVEVIGGSCDISAGQLIDRTGQALNLAFPSGMVADALALQGEGDGNPFAVKVHNLEFSLSGMENKVNELLARGEDGKAVCRFVFATLSKLISTVNAQAKERYGDLPLVFGGGVASSRFLRQAFPHDLFPEPKFCTDNAMGIALLAKRAFQEEETHESA